LTLAARLQALERRHRHGVRDQVDGKVGPVDTVHRQADAVYRDRALARDVLRQRLRRADDQLVALADLIELQHLADAVDVARDQVSAEAVGQAQRLFQVHFAGRVEADGAVQRLARDVDLVDGRLLDDRQADAAVGDRVAQRDVGEVEAGRLDGQAQALLQGCRWAILPVAATIPENTIGNRGISGNADFTREPPCGV
jgi:hypothetical protein